MSDGDGHVIVGGGMAGGKAAETLRAEGYDGRIVLIGDEPVRPYERPPLSKTYLRGESDFDQAAIHPADFYEAHAIELRESTTVDAVDVAASEVRLSDGERLGYQRVLLATGAAPRRLGVRGAELDGVHYLRTVADSDVIRAAVTAGSPVVVIGASWIGCEVAASARQLGADVTMVDQVSIPLVRALGPQVGAIYRDLHEEHGIHLRLGAEIRSLEGSGTVEEVRLEDGSAIPAGAVVVGIGVLPRTDLAAAAGLEIENGVVADQFLEATAPGVYVAGDLANAWHPLYGTRIRLEHWSSALNQGPAAARNMLREGSTPYEKLPYFFSDQYDLGMEYRGWAPTYDRVVFRGDVTTREFIAFWLDGGAVMAAMNANIWDQGDAIEALVAARPVVEPSLLTDPEVSLASLTPKT